MEHFADPTTELAIATPGDLSTLRNYDPAVDEVTVELQQAVLNMCYHLPGYEQQASVLHEELVSYLISHVAKEEKSSICIGIQPKTSDGTAAPCTNKAKHLNCCGMHKRQTFGTYVCGVTTMPTAELCVACESHGEETTRSFSASPALWSGIVVAWLRGLPITGPWTGSRARHFSVPVALTIARAGPRSRSLTSC